MEKQSEVNKYINMRKIISLRMRTKIGEEAARKVLQPHVPQNVAFVEMQYLLDADSFHACDFIYQTHECVEEVVENVDDHANGNAENVDDHVENIDNHAENIDDHAENADLKAEEQQGDVRPLHFDKKMPLIVYVHGGGWTVGSKEFRRGMLAQFALQGFFVVSMNYTLSPEAEQFESVREIYACTEFAIEKAAEFGIDVSRIFYMGDSAGGHLISLAAAAKSNGELGKMVGYDFSCEFDISAIVPICGVFNFRTVLACKFPWMKKFLWAYSRGKTSAFLKSERSYFESPVNFAADFPKTFIVFAEGDRLKRQSEEMILKLAENGKEVRCHIGRGKRAFHVFVAAFNTKIAKDCISDIVEYLKSIS